MVGLEQLPLMKLNFVSDSGCHSASSAISERQGIVGILAYSYASFGLDFANLGSEERVKNSSLQ
jgi:hypothetical protein